MIFSKRKNYGGLKEQKPTGSKQVISTPGFFIKGLPKEKERILYTASKTILSLLGRIKIRFTLPLLTISKVSLKVLIPNLIRIFLM
jgi:hypothetical protein